MNNINNQGFWKVIKEFNSLMSKSIKGPDCTKLESCSGDCCSIIIDVPKILAEEYVHRGFAKKSDFIRSNEFSFHMRLNEKNNKCFLFDEKINGCSVHFSGIKPPRCWVYPTGFENPKNEPISCKRTGGWQIIDPKGARKAEKLLEKYIFLCRLEARREKKLIEVRAGLTTDPKALRNREKLLEEIKSLSPKEIAGFKDGWDSFSVLPSEGISLSVKRFCEHFNNECTYLKDNFLNCPNTCDLISNSLTAFLEKILVKYVKEKGLEPDGEYPLYKLFAFEKEMGLLG